jgi:hypothetical protein
MADILNQYLLLPDDIREMVDKHLDMYIYKTLQQPSKERCLSQLMYIRDCRNRELLYGTGNAVEVSSELSHALSFEHGMYTNIYDILKTVLESIREGCTQRPSYILSLLNLSKMPDGPWWYSNAVKKLKELGHIRDLRVPSFIGRNFIMDILDDFDDAY